jgi:endoglucanase
MLAPPSTFGWTNVIYEMHEYQWSGRVSAVENGAVNQVNDFKNHQSWNIPDYIGEFNDFGNGTNVALPLPGFGNALGDQSWQ